MSTDPRRGVTTQTKDNNMTNISEFRPPYQSAGRTSALAAESVPNYSGKWPETTPTTLVERIRPPYQSASATSRRAASSMEGLTGNLRQQVLACLHQQASTDEELRTCRGRLGDRVVTGPIADPTTEELGGQADWLAKFRLPDEYRRLLQAVASFLGDIDDGIRKSRSKPTQPKSEERRKCNIKETISPWLLRPGVTLTRSKPGS